MYAQDCMNNQNLLLYVKSPTGDINVKGVAERAFLFSQAKMSQKRWRVFTTKLCNSWEETVTSWLRFFLTDLAFSFFFSKRSIFKSLRKSAFLNYQSLSKAMKNHKLKLWFPSMGRIRKLNVLILLKTSLRFENPC